MLILLILLALASPASAADLKLADGSTPQPEQGWVDASLVPSADGEINYRREVCPPAGYSACYYGGAERSLFFSVQPGDSRYRPTVLHEVGHDFDGQVLTDAYRGGFIRIMRYRTPSWSACSDPTPGSCQSAQERFADAYSLCARRDRISDDVHRLKAGAGYGYWPTPAQHRRVCALIRRSYQVPRRPR